MFVPRLTLAALILFAGIDCAAARLAHCLVEVDGKALISGLCNFDPLDHGGSFKISADNGAEAEVRITGKDATAAIRPPPQGRMTHPLAVDRDRGCWASLDDGNRKIKICAFSGPDFNVEPDPQIDNSAIVYWGSRLGMFDQIEKRQALDSAHAMVRTIPSRAAAMIYCREYAGDYTQACIAEAFAARHPEELTADCPKKQFTGFDGWRAAYIGLNHRDASGAPYPKYLFKDLASGQVLDGSGASNYGIAEGIYAALCPGAAITPEE